MYKRQGRSRLQVPAEIPEEAAETARALALQAFAAVDCHGLARVDFFLEEGGTVLLSELNTMPGFTPTSVYARLIEAAGIPYPELVSRLIDRAYTLVGVKPGIVFSSERSTRPPSSRKKSTRARPWQSTAAKACSASARAVAAAASGMSAGTWSRDIPGTYFVS